MVDFECLDGTKKTIRNTSVPVQDEAGVVLGAIVLNEDITALRQAQEALGQVLIRIAGEAAQFGDGGSQILDLRLNDFFHRIGL